MLRAQSAHALSERIEDYDLLTRVGRSFVSRLEVDYQDILGLLHEHLGYTHLAILRAAEPWLKADTVVVMEDDIPGYGELAIVKSELELRNVATHEIGDHPWPLVEFRVAS